MSYVQSYEYDIFISYAHLDNTKLFNESLGWIESFYKNLSMLLRRRTGDERPLKIWWDDKLLDGASLFDAAIEEGLKKSAILICLTSSAYIKRKFCLQELSAFHTAAKSQDIGLKINNGSRIFNVLLNNVPHTDWPVELQGTSGFKFNDSQGDADLGDPLEYDKHEFKTSLQDLRDAIMVRLSDIAAYHSPVLSGDDESGTKENDFKIFIGEVSDALRSTRKRTIIELEKKGFTVVSGVPPPLEFQPHERKIKEILERVDLSVNLLDQFQGREIMDAPQHVYTQRQTEIALDSGKRQVIWVPDTLVNEDIDDDVYRSFLQDVEAKKKYKSEYDFIRGNKSSLAREIIDIAEEIRAKSIVPPPPDTLSVLLDTHYNDQVYAWELGKVLLQNNIQPYVNPQEDDPRKNISMLADRIRQVTKMIFFYGKVTGTWVKERMIASLELILTNDIPVDELVVFLAPPHKRPDEILLNQRVVKVTVFDKSNEPQLNAFTMQDILQILKRK